MLGQKTVVVLRVPGDLEHAFFFVPFHEKSDRRRSASQPILNPETPFEHVPPLGLQRRYDEVGIRSRQLLFVAVEPFEKVSYGLGSDKHLRARCLLDELLQLRGRAIERA